MSVLDLSITIDGLNIYSPQDINDTPLLVRVTNLGDGSLENLGIYISPASNLGSIDQSMTYTPETDYQDLLTFGTNTVNEITAEGGIYISDLDQGEITFDGYITRTAGANISNKIPITNLAVNAFTEFYITFETPTGGSARRFYIDFYVE